MKTQVSAYIQQSIPEKIVLPSIISKVFSELSDGKDIYLVGSASAHLYSSQFHHAKIKQSDFKDIDFVGKCDPTILIKAGFIKDFYNTRLYTKTVNDCKVDFILMDENESIASDCKKRDLTNGALYFKADGSYEDPSNFAKHDIQHKLLRSPDPGLILTPVQIVRRIKWMLRGWTLHQTNELTNWIPPQKEEFEKTRAHLYVVTCQLLETLGNNEEYQFISMLHQQELLNKLYGIENLPFQINVNFIFKQLKQIIDFNSYSRKKYSRKTIFIAPPPAEPNAYENILLGNIKLLSQQYLKNQPETAKMLTANKNNFINNLIINIKNVYKQHTLDANLLSYCSDTKNMLEKFNDGYNKSIIYLDNLMIKLTELQEYIEEKIIKVSNTNSNKTLTLSNTSCND